MNDFERVRQALRSTAFDETLADHLGLNPTDLRCLEAVMAEPGLTAGRLAEASALTTGAVTGVLDRLERAGFVERRPDPADRRSVAIHPVEARAREVATAIRPLQTALEELFGDRTATE